MAEESCVKEGFDKSRAAEVIETLHNGNGQWENLKKQRTARSSRATDSGFKL